MPSIKLKETGEATIRFSKSGHSGKAVMAELDNPEGSLDLHLTSKQARALAGWINSNIPKEDEGIEYED